MANHIAGRRADLRASFHNALITNRGECSYLFDAVQRDAVLNSGLTLFHEAGLIYLGPKATPAHRFYIHDGGPDIDARLKDFHAACRQRGIRTTPYKCLFTVSRYMLEQHPEARAWLTADENDQLMPQAYYDHPDRFSGCIHNPGWVQHLKDFIDKSLELGFTATFWDNPIWFRCRCGFCRTKWSEHLETVGRKRRPIPIRMDWSDANWHEYHAWLANCVGDVIGKLTRYARRRNPDHVTYLNTTPPHKIPPASEALPTNLVAANADAILYELGSNAPHRREYKLTWNVPTMSFGEDEAKGRPILLCPYWTPRGIDHIDEKYGRLAIAEGFVYGIAELPSHGFYLKDFTELSRLRPYYDFFNTHAAELGRAKPLADVAVYFSWDTACWYYAPMLNRLFGRGMMIYGNGDVSYVGACDSVALRHVPFVTVTDLNAIAARRKPTHQVMLLANVTSLTAEECRLITALVRAGMGLVVTGDTSLYDRGTPRKDYGLKNLLGVSYPADQPVRRQVGAGRVAFHPERLEMSASLGVPAMLAQLHAELDWVANGSYSVESSAEDGNGSYLMRALRDGKKWYIHLLNYRIDDDHGIRPAKNIRVSIAGRVTSAVVHSPDAPGCDAAIEYKDGRSIVLVPEVAIYSLLVLE